MVAATSKEQRLSIFSKFKTLYYIHENFGESSLMKQMSLKSTGWSLVISLYILIDIGKENLTN